MTDIISKLKSVKCGLESAMNYISEDLEAICDDTMRDYAESAIQDAEASLSVLDSLIESIQGNSDKQTNDDKPYKISYILGTEAVREYNNCVDNGEKWSVSSLCDCGSVSHVSFATQAELDAYKEGIQDATGYLESERMMTDEEWQQYLDEYKSDE